MVVKADAKIDLVSLVPSGHRNRGPCFFPRTKRYFTIASTGHTLLLVFERKNGRTFSIRISFGLLYMKLYKCW